MIRLEKEEIVKSKNTSKPSRKDFEAIDADVSELKGRMEKTKATATTRRAEVAKAAAEEARKAEMMAGLSAGYDKEAAAIRRKPNKRTMKRSKFLVKPDPSEAEETEA